MMFNGDSKLTKIVEGGAYVTAGWIEKVNKVNQNMKRGLQRVGLSINYFLRALIIFCAF